MPNEEIYLLKSSADKIRDRRENIRIEIIIIPEIGHQKVEVELWHKSVVKKTRDCGRYGWWRMSIIIIVE